MLSFCFEIFDEQSADYKRKILGDKPRVSIEAGSTQSWYKYLDHSDLIIGVDRLLDMTRTAVNVTGDAMVSSVVAVSEDEFDLETFHSEK